MQTILDNYTLWYDGEISISPEELTSLILSKPMKTSCIHTTEMTPEILQYNKYCEKDERITVKKDIKPLDFNWNIPDEYKQLNIEEVVLKLLQDEIKTFSKTDQQQRCERVLLELTLFEKNKMFDVLKTIFYIINTFIANNVVWGVGRGSSVSSYILYLMKVHDIDSVQYDLNIRDFIS